MSVSKLKPVDDHYMAYVGPPTQYDFMGATQFRLLCTLGLRAHHTLLDFGCGSLRAGRLFINYLDEGRYFGIDPNKWLIDDCVVNQLGNDLIRIKKPRFDYNDDFSVNFDVKFDFIVAQSIFSHTGSDLVQLALPNLMGALKDDGIIVMTFVEGEKSSGEKGWVYPDCVEFTPREISGFLRDTGAFARKIPWYHPRQSWYLLAKKKDRLPAESLNRYLTGAVLFDPGFADSVKGDKGNDRLMSRAKRFVGNILSPGFKRGLS